MLVLDGHSVVMALVAAVVLECLKNSRYDNMTLSWETTAFENPKLQTDNCYDIMIFSYGTFRLIHKTKVQMVF